MPPSVTRAGSAVRVRSLRSGFAPVRGGGLLTGKRQKAANHSQPLLRAIRAASTRLAAPSLLIASDR